MGLSSTKKVGWQLSRTLVPDILTVLQGKFCYNELIPSRSLEDTTLFLEGNERESFLSFVRDMLTWLPEKRKTARELMDHPFLKLGG